ncbi:MAG: hypothetical protein V2I41_03935 [Pseudomonadales bacterium]|nr:hypothetical protein [Pseudomonadales bacterium]
MDHRLEAAIKGALSVDRHACRAFSLKDVTVCPLCGGTLRVISVLRRNLGGTN